MLFAPKEKCQALVDYSLIILLIAIVIIFALMAFGTQLNVLYSEIVEQLPM